MQTKGIKRYIALILAACFILAGFLTEFISRQCIKSIPEQNAALYYKTDTKFAQLSLFASERAGFTKKMLPAVRGSIAKSFNEKTDTSPVQGRVLIDAYSAKTNLRFTADRSAADLETMAVGGDFFFFHPNELVSGTYFSDDTDENGDGLVLNELAAWQLFGGTDVSGLYVRAGGMELCVRGVIKEDDAPFAKQAGLDEARAYLAFEAADRINGENELSITCYEVLMMDPVRDFAAEAVKEGMKAAGVDDRECVITENSGRFSYISRIKLIGSFFTRAMNTTDVGCPYWENRARAYEQLFMLLMVFELMFFAAAFILGTVGTVFVVTDIKSRLKDRRKKPYAV